MQFDLVVKQQRQFNKCFHNLDFESMIEDAFRGMIGREAEKYGTELWEIPL